MSSQVQPAPYKAPRIQPLMAARALKNLLKDPQDTRQVALLTTALRGKSGIIQYNRFRDSSVGARILAERRQLADTLDNHAYLATLPENTFGRRYLAFMAEENLSAKGLKSVTADATDMLKNASEEVQIFADRTCMTCTTSSPVMAATNLAKFACLPFPTRSSACAALPLSPVSARSISPACSTNMESARRASSPPSPKLIKTAKKPPGFPAKTSKPCSPKTSKIFAAG
jgi:hypothetical protein